MQPGTATGCALTWIRDDGNRLGRSDEIRRHDDAEQLGGRRTLSAPDACPNRALAFVQEPGLVRVGCRRRSDDH